MACKCVYKYVDNEEIVYIGKTDGRLKQRIAEHSREDKFYDYKNCEIYYTTFDHSYEIEAFETMMINKYKPRLNTAKISNSFAFDFDEPQWTKFDKADQDTNNVHINSASSSLKVLEHIQTQRKKQLMTKADALDKECSRLSEERERISIAEKTAHSLAIMLTQELQYLDCEKEIWAIYRLFDKLSVAWNERTNLFCEALDELEKTRSDIGKLKQTEGSD